MSNVVTSWPVVSLYDFCNPKQWPTIPQTAFVDQGYPVYGANGKIGHYTEFNHEKPTVLITCRGATCGTINVCEPKSYVTGNAMALDDLDESRVSSEYLVYALRNGSLAQAITGTAQPQITRQSLTAISIPLPPLAEQRRIAEVLDRAEALRAKRRAALALLDTLTQSLFLDLFGDPVRLQAGQLPTVRDAISRGKLLEIQDGNHGEKHPKVEEFSETGIPFITANCLNDGQLNLTTCYFLPPSWLKRLRIGFAQAGDVLLSHKGSIGLTAIVPASEDSIILSPQVTYYRPNPESLLPQFLRGFFQTNSFQAKMKKEAEQTTRSYLGITRQLDLPLLLPAIERQREFARRVGAVEKLKSAQRASLAELDALFATLQHRAFRGEL